MERKENPCISIIIPIYNVQPYLKRCLDSVICQSYENLEIILVNDGTQDNCGIIAEEYADKDKRIKVIHQENQGLASARNTGLEKASGEWISFVDSDDEISVDMIKNLWEIAEKEKVSMSMGGYYTCTHYASKVKMKQVHVQEQVISDTVGLHRYFMAEGKNFAYVCIKLYHKSVFDKVRFPVGKHYEDIYVLPEIIEAAGNMVIVDIPMYYYHLRSDSISGGGKILNHMDGLQARLMWKTITESRYPQLIGYSADAVLEWCCFLLGKLYFLGRKQHIQYWNQVTECFRQHQSIAKKDNIYLKIAIPIFRISPVLLGKICDLYGKIKNI